MVIWRDRFAKTSAAFMQGDTPHPAGQERAEQAHRVAARGLGVDDEGLAELLPEGGLAGDGSSVSIAGALYARQATRAMREGVAAAAAAAAQLKRARLSVSD